MNKPPIDLNALTKSATPTKKETLKQSVQASNNPPDLYAFVKPTEMVKHNVQQFQDKPNIMDQLAGALDNPEIDDEDENEPEPDAINLPTIQIPKLAQAGEHDSDEVINRQHLQMSNLELNVIYAMWPQVKSITSVCKLIDASIKAVKHQRDLLCLPYGYRGESTRKDIVFPPIDD